MRRSELNTLTVMVERGGPVQVSFFGGLGLGQVEPAGNANGPGIKVASLVDLAGCKVAVGTGGQNHQGMAWIVSCDRGLRQEASRCGGILIGIILTQESFFLFTMPSGKSAYFACLGDRR